MRSGRVLLAQSQRLSHQDQRTLCIPSRKNRPSLGQIAAAAVAVAPTSTAAHV